MLVVRVILSTLFSGDGSLMLGVERYSCFSSPLTHGLRRTITLLVPILQTVALSSFCTGRLR